MSEQAQKQEGQEQKQEPAKQEQAQVPFINLDPILEAPPVPPPEAPPAPPPKQESK